jgi:hypothetical protein
MRCHAAGENAILKNAYIMLVIPSSTPPIPPVRHSCSTPCNTTSLQESYSAGGGGAAPASGAALCTAPCPAEGERLEWTTGECVTWLVGSIVASWRSISPVSKTPQPLVLVITYQVP